MSSVHRGCPFALLLRFLLEIAITTASSSLQSISSLTLEPKYVHDLVADKNTTVMLTVTVDSNRKNYKRFVQKQPWRLSFKSLSQDIASVGYRGKELFLTDFNETSDGKQKYETSFTVFGNFLGKTAIKIHLLSADENDDDDEAFMQQYVENESEPLHSENSWIFDVWVRQSSSRILNQLFLTTLITLIVIANILMGCELDMAIILETLKKPVAPSIGFFCQFLIMPMLAYGIAHVIFMSRGLHSFALGLFVTGCAPGGGASNYWTILLDGNLPVSVTMTFVSTLAALVMMPFWMWALGGNFLGGYHQEASIKVPYLKIVSSMIMLVVPLFFGIFLVRWKPIVRQKARKIMRPFIIFVLIFVVCFGTAANLYMFYIMTWTALIGGLLLPWCGFTFGCIFSILFRQPPPNVTAIAIETGIQNTGIAIMLLKFSFPEPDADISALIPVIAASLTPFPLLLGVSIHHGLKMWKKRRLTIKHVEKNIITISAEMVAVTDLNNAEERNLLGQNQSRINCPTPI